MNGPYPSVLAVDVGYGNLKSVWAAGSVSSDDAQSQAWGETVFRSVAPKIWGQSEGLSTADRIAVPVGDDAFWVGPGAGVTGSEDGVIEQSVHNINTKEYQALVSGAWSYMMKDLGKVIQSVDTLVVGLPMSGYKANRDVLKQAVSGVREVPVPAELRKLIGKSAVSVFAKDVLVLPQPFGGFRYACAKNPKLNEVGATTLLIDPGYSTFDWLVTEDGNIRVELCDSFEGGVSSIYSAIATRISQDHGCGSPSFSLIEKAFERGTIMLGGKAVAIEPYRQVQRQAADSIVNEFLRRIDPDRLGVTNIVIGGGGSAFFVEAIRRRLPSYQIDLLENAVMANARGFFLAAA